MTANTWNRLVAGLVLLIAGMAAGAAMESPNQARGAFGDPPPPVPFKSGDQLSVPILKDIAATLQKIDARVARLETAAQKLSTARGGK
jgi:hypothetical protein